MKGFTIIEILVAIVILGFVSASFVALFNFSLRANSQNEKNLMALNLAKENLEIIRALHNESWNYLAGLAMGANYHIVKNGDQWALSQGAESISTFNRRVIIDNVYRDINDNIITSGGVLDPDTKKITSIVEWTNQNITLTTYLTHWQ